MTKKTRKPDRFDDAAKAIAQKYAYAERGTFVDNLADDIAEALREEREACAEACDLYAEGAEASGVDNGPDRAKAARALAATFRSRT